MLTDLAQDSQVRVIFLVSRDASDDFIRWLGDEKVEVIPYLPKVKLAPLLRAIQPDLLISLLYSPESFEALHSLNIPHLILAPDTAQLELMGSITGNGSRLPGLNKDPLPHSENSTNLTTPASIGVISPASLPTPEPGSPYILYPIHSQPSDHYDLLIQIMKEVWLVQPELKLILTGRSEPEVITDLVRRYGCPPEQIMRLDDGLNGHSVRLYKQAEALLVISPYEGFAMPVLEAMVNGCPVICGSLAPLWEAASESVLYVNSDQPADWAKALLHVLPARRLSLIEQGLAQADRFSWQSFQHQWRQRLIEAGLDLPLSSKTSQASQFDKPAEFTEINSNLGQPLAPTATETVIKELQQELTLKTELLKEQQEQLTAQDEQIKTQEALIFDQYRELVAKEQIIRQLDAFRRLAWPYRKAIYFKQKSTNKAKQWFLRYFAPRLGVLYHYPPIPLRNPNWYTIHSTPASSLPVISMVTPSFNQAVFLERTLKSILDQNYPALEYIVQDGGSTDDTSIVLDCYRSRLAACVSMKDKGQAHAINLGFAQTSGDIMAWLNSDDLLLPGALNYIARFFSQHPEVDVVYGHRVLIDENDDEIGRWVLPPHDKHVLLWADYVPQETLFWRRRVWDKIGGSLDETFRFTLDWDLLLRFQAAGVTMVRLPRFLGAFRVHVAQKTSAQIGGIGKTEMDRLRERCHGRSVSRAEIGRGIGPYLIRSVIYHKLYRLGLIRY